MRRDNSTTLAVLILVAFASGRSCEVKAQDELMVARVCLSESPRDCTAIAHVLSERAALRGVTVRQMAFAYAPMSTGRRPYTARPWIPTAHPDRAAPPGFPRFASWERTRTLLAALTVTAYRGLRGIDDTPCRGAIHWASRGCVRCARRMARTNHVLIDCDSSNAFFAEGT